jgi:pyridoxal phosphate-dependent aminotransferase EpsN
MNNSIMKRIYLSSPHMSGLEQHYVQDAFDTNWIAPLGPHVDAFEQEFCSAIGIHYAAALSSGTAALHLALMLVGVGRDDEVIVSDLTFSASVNPIVYLGGKPTFVDSQRSSWNMDPNLLEDILAKRAQFGKLPKAVILVHLYGQSADVDPILAMCGRYGIPLIEDAAEALGATYKGHSPGTLGRMGIFSFNGNKIITTSGGGMLVADDEALIKHARKLATQARDPAPYYQHTEIGYNYRLSNVCAAIGRGQLPALHKRIAARRHNFDCYKNALGEVDGIAFMPEASWGHSTRWLTCITVDPVRFGADRETVRLALERENIESRPVWKPMHLQPIFSGCECVGGSVSEDLFLHGLCLPSGSNLTDDDLSSVIDAIRQLARKNASTASSQASLHGA